jgi:hypothetical protein
MSFGPNRDFDCSGASPTEAYMDACRSSNDLAYWRAGEGSSLISSLLMQARISLLALMGFADEVLI